MSFAEIEAELDKLGAEDLRRLALKSWAAFVQKEGRTEGANECDENDPRLLAALDQAIAEADATSGQGHSGSQVRAALALARERDQQIEAGGVCPVLHDEMMARLRR